MKFIIAELDTRSGGGGGGAVSFVLFQLGGGGALYNILKELSQAAGFITPRAKDFHITAGEKPLLGGAAAFFGNKTNDLFAPRISEILHCPPRKLSQHKKCHVELNYSRNYINLCRMQSAVTRDDL